MHVAEAATSGVQGCNLRCPRLQPQVFGRGPGVAFEERRPEALKLPEASWSRSSWTVQPLGVGSSSPPMGAETMALESCHATFSLALSTSAAPSESTTHLQP